MAYKHNARWIQCGLGLVLFCCLSFPSFGAGVLPVTPTATYPYACGATTALQMEMCIYQDWINRYGLTGCGFDQFTWQDTPTAVLGWIPFSPICGYGHILPMVLTKVFACPVHATATPNGAAMACSCDTGYAPDQAGTSCVSECPVPALSNPPFADACATALEDNSTQAQKDAACGTITPAMASGQQCLSNAIAAKGIPFNVTSQVRSLAYQAHFREIWNGMEALAAITDPAVQQACAARRTEYAAEKGCDNGGACVTCSGSGRNHCLKQTPAKPSSAAQHANRNAIDVSAAQTITPLQTYLNGLRPPQTITQFIAAQNCAITCATVPPSTGSLIWGGTFKVRDPVHFTTTCP